ncbi:DUF3558 domain-containing protein [Solihabitans fulvus]|uniref:DUF3558 domain-containing protein n=1 Tax=Solihabitans fulvus TaxID=1892852 RepID=A0A5B2WNJ7_9PSEU|nr:DUF3558 domain-containing protein [Solihabitans fulvus]KAA2252558.1 DUF3558 domain-containing protein [Solihabitans fulvus]
MRATVGVLVTACLAGAAAMLAGCSSDQPQSQPAPSSSTAPSRLSPPLVKEDLEVTKYRADPCALIRADQLAQFGITAPGSVVDGWRCAWHPNVAARPSYRAGVDLTSGGLEGLYRKRSTLPMFTPDEVDGYPAVRTADDPHATDHGRCTVEVGVAATSLVVVDVQVADERSLDYRDPCPLASTFAGYVIGNLVSLAP